MLDAKQRCYIKKYHCQSRNPPRNMKYISTSVKDEMRETDTWKNSKIHTEKKSARGLQIRRSSPKDAQVERNGNPRNRSPKTFLQDPGRLSSTSCWRALRQAGFGTEIESARAGSRTVNRPRGQVGRVDTSGFA